MSTFLDDRIKNKIRHDDEAFSDAFVSLGEIIMDKSLAGLFSDSRKNSSNEALEEVLSFYGFQESLNVPKSITDIEEYLDFVLNPIGVMRRPVTLNNQWYKDAFGAFLGVLDDTYTVALIPSLKGYVCISPAIGERFYVNKKNHHRISTAAICFYPPLPEKPLTSKDIIKQVIKSAKISDVIKIAIFSVLVTLVSVLIPYITQFLFNNVALQESYKPLISLFVFMVGIYLSSSMLDIGRDFAVQEISIKADSILCSAVLMRLINLPPAFFRKYNAGDLQSRIQGSKVIASGSIDFIFGTGISVLTSFIYLLQIRSFSPALVLPSIVIIAILAAFFFMYYYAQSKVSRKLQLAYAKESGFLVSMINGIQKIRLTGSEKRVFSQWADIYKKRAQLQYKQPFILVQNTTITTLITLLGSCLLYYCTLKSGIDAGTYMGFIASYGMLSGVLIDLVTSVTDISDIKAQLNQFKPVLEEKPESAASKRTVKKLSGSIDVNNVSFKYTDSQPLVIDGLSFSVKPGEYLGIVGKSGCGKSTLIRLLLGFEKPTRGSISYDMNDLNSLEPRSVRRQIGCVLQDNGLFTDSIRNNITLTAPFATDEEVWEACRLACIDKDIKEMPMGLETVVFDASSTISGGQKQRIMIARALIGKPGILFFDEATSALDNNTQRMVSDTLASLNCTRVVVAHRLSAVKQCDRIIMLEDGKIIEEGSYDELMMMNGKFADMVSRQLD